MYLRKIKQFNLCFYRLCSLIPMNIDKLIVNCVVDNHTVETLVIGHIFAMRRYLLEIVVINRGRNARTRPSKDVSSKGNIS